MKNGVCPKCSSRELFAIDEAMVPNYEFSNSVEPFTLTAHYGDTAETSFLGLPKQARSVVRVEVRICARCSYAELYAKDLEVLARFAKDGHGGVRRISS
ncbi:MAG TPA: hypothetical protein VGI10_29370 [Polyangiaceae bacterium]|jgi:predicted nucleic-acid-binding Zn-ribbon protein